MLRGSAFVKTEINDREEVKDEVKTALRYIPSGVTGRYIPSGATGKYIPRTPTWVHIPQDAYMGAYTQDPRV